MLKEIKNKREHYFVDDQNRKQGEYKSYYDDGQLWVHAFYINGKRHGEYKHHHSNGQLWEHSFYQNGKLHGEYKRYNYNGTLCRTTFCYQGIDFKVDLNSLTEKDKTYILLSGRLPPRD